MPQIFKLSQKVNDGVKTFKLTGVKAEDVLTVGERKRTNINPEIIKENSRDKAMTLHERNNHIVPVKSKKKSAISKFLADFADDYSTDIAPTNDNRTWFQKGSLEDGVTAKNVGKGIVATGVDITENASTGIIGMGEKFIDWLFTVGEAQTQANLQQLANDTIENKARKGEDTEGIREKYDAIGKDVKKETAEIIAKDLYNEEKIAKQIISDPVKKHTGIDAETDSFLGEKSDALVQSAGQLAATVGLQAVGVPWWATTGATAYGSEMENALNQGATFEEAKISAAITAGSEILTEKISGGIKFGGKALDDVVTDAIAKNISKKFLRTAAKFGLDAFGEGSEELLSGGLSKFGQWLTYRSEEELTELLFSEEAIDEAIESFIGGTLLGGASSGIKAVKSKVEGKDYVTGLTQNEQKVFEKEYESRIAEAEKDGKKLTQKQKNKIYDNVLNDMEKGYISTDTIEEVLGGEDYKAYKEIAKLTDGLTKEIVELVNKENHTLADQYKFSNLMNRLKDSNSKKDVARAKLDKKMYPFLKNSLLIESYNVRARKGQPFETNLTQYDTKYQDEIKKTSESGILKNSALQSGANSGIIENEAKSKRFSDYQHKASIMRYKSGEAYKINAMLREGEVLDEASQEFVDTLNEALQELPTYEGTVYRNVTFDDFGGQKAFDEFLLLHTPGKPVFYNQFLSCSTKQDGYPVEGEQKVQIIIESKNARNVDGYGNNMESEVIYPNHSAFIVDKVNFDGESPVIYLQEMIINGYESFEKRGSAVRNLQESYFTHDNLQRISAGDTVGNTVRSIRPQPSSSERPGDTVRAGGRQGAVLSTEGEEQANKQITNSEATLNTEAASFMSKTPQERNLQAMINATTGRNIENGDKAKRLKKEIKRYNPKTEGQKEAKRVADELGLEVVFEDTVETRGGYRNGYIDENNVIHIDFREQQPAKFVLVHELTHYCEQTGQYGKFAKALKKSKLYEQWLHETTKMPNAKVEVMEARYRNAVIEQRGWENAKDAVHRADREMVADFCGTKLFGVKDTTDMQTLLDGLTNTEKQTVMKVLSAFFKRIGAKLTGNAMTIQSLDLAKLERLYSQMYNEAKNNPTKKGEVRDSIGGPNALTANKSKLFEAINRNSNGENPETVRRETGWYKGKDGKWRFYIPDNELNVDALSKNGNTVQVLGDCIIHNKLFAAYPELKNIKIRFDDIGKTKKGTFFVEENEIILNNKLKGETEKIKDTLVHELQHAIQYIEGFATGGNKDIGFIYAMNIAYNKAKNTLRFNQLSTNSDKLNYLIMVAKKTFNADSYEKMRYKAYQSIYGETEARQVTRNRLFDEDLLRLATPDTSGNVVNIDDEGIKFIENFIEMGYTKEEIINLFGGMQSDESGSSGNIAESNSKKHEDLRRTSRNNIEQADRRNTENNIGSRKSTGDMERGIRSEVSKRVGMGRMGRGIESDSYSDEEIFSGEADLKESAFSMPETKDSITVDFDDVDKDIYEDYNYDSHYGERLHNTPQRLRPSTDREWQVFCRSFANKTNGMKKGEYRNIDIFTDKYLYLVEADGYMSGIVYSKIDIDNYESRGYIYDNIRDADDSDRLYEIIGDRQGNNGNSSSSSGEETPAKRISEMVSFIESHPEWFGDKRENYRDYKRRVEAERKASAFSMPETKDSITVDMESEESQTEDFTAAMRDLSKRFKSGELTSDEFLLLVNELYNKAGEQHGRIKKGETVTGNERFDSPVPKSVSDGKKVGRFARTIIEGGELTDEMISVTKQQILSGDLSYTPSSNEKVIKLAQQRMANGNPNRDWQSVSNGDKTPSAVDMAVGELLLKQAIESKDAVRVVELTAELVEVGTRLGQAVQALSLLKRMDGISQLVYIQRCVDGLNRDLAKRFKKNFGNKINAVEINEDLALQLARSKTEADFEISYYAIIDNIANQVPSTFLDKFNAWRYLAMLFNSTTHIRNFLGNAIFIPSVKVKNVIAAAIENVAVDTSDRTKSLTVKKQYKDFAKKDFINVKDILSEGGKMNPKMSIADNRRIFKSKALETIRKSNFELLEKEDMIFLKYHYAQALGGYLQARKISIDNISHDVLQKARLYAMGEALKATYRDVSKVANIISQISRSNAFANIAVEGLLPFKKTPINIVKRGVEYSPLGLVKTLGKAIYDLNQGTYTATEFIDGLASNFTGSGIMVLGMLLASCGAVTGGFDDDDESWFRKLMGEQEYSVVIGNKSYTIDWLAPACIPFFMGVAIAETWDKNSSDSKWQGVATAVGAGLEPIVNLSMLSGIQDTIASVRYSDANTVIQTLLGNMIGSYFSQLLPTVGGKLANTIDDTRRTTYIDKNSDVPRWLQTAFDTVAKKTPLLSQTRQEYINAWGETEKTGNVAERILSNFVSPGYFSETDKTEVSEELQRLAKATGNNSVYPDIALRRVRFKNYTKQLSRKEYTVYATVKGQAQADYLKEVINNKEYKKLTDEQKAKVITDLYKFANAKAKSKISYSYDELNILHDGVITKEQYKRLSEKARMGLAEEYFMSDFKKVYRTERNGGSAVDYYVRRVKD